MTLKWTWYEKGSHDSRGLSPAGMAVGGGKTRRRPGSRGGQGGAVDALRRGSRRWGREEFCDGWEEGAMVGRRRVRLGLGAAGEKPEDGPRQKPTG